MKKLIAFSVIFALLAGAVFAADFDLAGTLSFDASIGVTLFDLTGLDPFGATASGIGGSGWGDDAKFELGLNYSTDYWGVEGIKITAKATNIPGDMDNYFRFDGSVTKGWWKPVDNTKITLGGASDYARYADEDDDGNRIYADLWWFFDGQGGNWVGVEVSDISDMITLNLSFIEKDEYEIEHQYIDRFVIQAIIDLADMGEAGVTFNNVPGSDRGFYVDYANDFGDFGLLAAFGFAIDRESWGLGVEVTTDFVTVEFKTTEFEHLFAGAYFNLAGIDPWVELETKNTFDYTTLDAGAGYEISGVSLTAKLSTNFDFGFLKLDIGAKYSISGINLAAGFTTDLMDFDTLNVWVKADTEFKYELDMFDVKIAPAIIVNFVGKYTANEFLYGDHAVFADFGLAWKVPITLEKDLDGFKFESGIEIGGHTDWDFLDYFKVPVMFKYSW